MKLSVVILNYNVSFFLHQCILSVQRAVKGLEAEIIVVDNNSGDGSAAMMKQFFPDLLFIQNNENVGFSKANNQAVAQAKGEYVCILNPDTAVSEDTFVQCFSYLETLENPGALGTYLMDGTGHFLPESKRNLPTPKASLFKLLRIPIKKYSYYAVDIAPKQAGPVSILVGAFMLLKKDIYTQIGGFDESYFMYGEDIDFSYKIEKLGLKNYYFGATTVMHYKGESTQKDGVYLDRFYGAMQIFYKKHFKTGFILDTSVKLGVKLAKWSKSIKLSPKQNQLHEEIELDKEVLLFTENFSLLRALSQKLEYPIKTSSKSILSEDTITNTILIFDIDYMSYAQVFMVMQKLKGKGNKFRIRPPGCNFILGSDQSDQKGVVVEF